MPESIVIVGAGIMGSGIAQILISSGYKVILNDVKEEALKVSAENISSRIGRKWEGREGGERFLAETLSLLKTETDISNLLSDATMIIEAVPEDLELKKKVLSEISVFSGEKVVIASNTSSLPISRLASDCKYPERIVGMHWFNPAPLMKLVEIVRGAETSTWALEKTVEVARKAGKEVIVVQDGQGFVTTRVLTAFLLECYRVFQEGIASIEDIDKASRLAFNHPMGPFELSDMIGLDTILSASKGLEEAFGARFSAPPLLVDLVKAGSGFFEKKDGS